MAKVRIEFETDNAAFDESYDYECKRVLQIATRALRERLTYRPLLDSNGNTIGKVEVTE